MKHTLIVFLLSFTSSGLFPQQSLIIQQEEFVDTETGTSQGVNIPRSERTFFQFLNNSLTSVNASGYMLQAGDENPGDNNYNLDGEIISGNIFEWNGTDETSMTHALFTGFNLDVIVRYNYLLNTPNGIQRKSDGMTDLNGVIAYNIIKNPKLGVAVKGINGIKIYNNTFYSDKTSDQTWRGLIDIYNNTDNGLNVPSRSTKVFNNIFYTRNHINNITIQDTECLEGFECDYNLYWCEAGEPILQVDGKIKTFAMWQAMGYDLHSVVINPVFIDNDGFVPQTRLDYGVALGDDFKEGLSTDAIWDKSPPETSVQNGVWQVGARVYASEDDDEEEPVYPQNVTLIYPNPALDYFNILISNPNQVYQKFTMYDSVGNLIMQGSIEFGLNKVPLQGEIASGLYTVTLEAEGLESLMEKVIILN